MTRRIDSPSNDTVKQLARLLERRYRTAEGHFLVEGRREVGRAFEAGVDVETVIVAPDLVGDDESLEPDLELSVAAFSRISMRQNPDGFALVVRTPELSLDKLPAPDLILVVDGMEKPGNIGAMLRTADACGASVLLSDPVTDAFNPNVIRASQGSVFSVPLASTSGQDARLWLEDRCSIVVAVSAATSTSWEADLTNAVAIVIGGEHEGVGKVWTGAPTVSIPMAGSADSLNASVTAALLLYEAIRQRSAPIR